jgi:membrane associated rhomboid family serine protease
VIHTIPLRDTIPSRRFPVVSVTLIVINVVVFFYEFSLGQRVRPLIASFGVVPVSFFGGGNLSEFPLRPQVLLTSMFLHGGWLHVGGNMLYLWIFGDNVEDRLGRVRFLFFYLACGVAAGITHVVANPHSVAPTIGASGAVAGVLGAYFLLYPKARVLTLLPLGIYFQIIELPAFFFLGFWLLIQSISGIASLAVRGEMVGGIAWWAHIGGFAFGAALGLLLKKKGGRYR